MENRISEVNTFPLVNSSASILEQKNKNLSDTDQKVNCVVILRGFLVVTAMCIGITGFILSVVLNPVFLAAAIPSIALAILGGRAFFPYLLDTNDSEKKGKTNLEDYLPIEVPGQPLGLRNACCNCWVNAALHLLFDLDSFAPLLDAISKLPDDVYEELKTCVKNYQESTTRVSSVNSQEIRTWLVSEGVDIRPNSWNQEDAIVFFDHLFAITAQRLEIVQTCMSADQSEQQEPIPTKPQFPYINLEIDLENYGIDLKKRDHPSISFDDLFANFFKTITDSNNALKKRFYNKPDHFMLVVQRFGRDESAGVNAKIHSRVDVPTQLNLKNCIYPESEEDINYSCDGFIQHRGSLNGGHYVAYIYKLGKWWCCNDRVVTVVSESEINSAMSSAYIYHYRNVKPEQEVL